MGCDEWTCAIGALSSAHLGRPLEFGWMPIHVGCHFESQVRMFGLQIQGESMAWSFTIQDVELGKMKPNVITDTSKEVWISIGLHVY